MKKFMLGIVAVSLVSVAAMGAAFDIAPAAVQPVGIDPGQSVWISVNTTGAIQGMNLYLGVDNTAAFAVTGLVIDTGTVFEGRESAPATIVLDPSYAIGIVTTNTGTVGPGVIAKIQITAVGAKGDVAVLSTNSPAVGSPSDFGDGLDAGQDDLALVITPEPMTALMLLAVVPFLRRRHV